MLPRRLTFASLAVFSTVVVGTAGYYAIGRGAWTFVDCLYPPPDHVLAGGETRSSCSAIPSTCGGSAPRRRR